MSLLLMVGVAIKCVVYSGYGVAGTYFVRTGVRYVKDYRESIAKERA